MEEDNWKEILRTAVRNNDIQKVMFLQNLHPNVIETIYEKGTTLLHLARHLEMLEYLLNYLPNIDVRNKYEATPLHCAADSGNEDIIKVLLRNKANISLRAKYGTTALHNAAGKGHYNIVKLLIEHGEIDNIDINPRSDRDYTPLHLAVMSSKKSTVNYLLMKGANIDARCIKGRTCLHYAMRSEIVEILLRHRADVNSLDHNLNSAIHIHSSKGFTSNVELLVRNEAEIMLKNRDDYTPLYFAAKKGYTDIAIILLTNYPYDYSELLIAPIEEALLCGHKSFAKLLIEYCSDINVCDKSGCTLLHLVTEKGELDIVKTLIHKGAEINKINSYGQTALHRAVVNDHVEIVRVLLNAEVRTNVEDKRGRTPLHYAATPDMLFYLITGDDQFTAEQLEEKLDKCIQKNQKDICFNYEPLLMYQSSNFEAILPMIFYLSQEKKFEHLLRHPTINIFLVLIWKRVAPYFYINLFFSVFSFLSILCYQALFYSSDTPLSSFGYVSYIIVLLTLILFILLEAIQINITGRSYFENVGNIFEVGLVLYIAILTTWYPSLNVRIQLSALGNILIAICLTFILGHHPVASSAVHLLRIVTYKFTQYFVIYLPIILSFALSLHQLQTMQDIYVNAASNKEEEDGNVDTLKESGVRILQTMGMFVGELNLNDFFPSEGNGLVLVLILTSFVIFISIIILNLLNGLAISDVLERNELEISNYKAQLEYFHNMHKYIKWMLNTIENKREIKSRFKNFICSCYSKFRSEMKGFGKVTFIWEHPKNLWHNMISLFQQSPDSVDYILIVPNVIKRKSYNLDNNRSYYIHNKDIYKNTCERLNDKRKRESDQKHSSSAAINEILARTKQLQDDLQAIIGNSQ